MQKLLKRKRAFSFLIINFGGVSLCCFRTAGLKRKEIVHEAFLQIMKLPNINIKNKRASFDYELLDTYTAGLILTGTEIKSIRLGKAGLVDTFCVFDKDELWVRNMYIGEYFYGSYNNHSARRERKLLLNKKELKKIMKMTKESGYTIVPLKLFINERGLAKLNIAVARGKKQYDKRQSLKEKEDKRSMDRAFKK